MVGAMANIWVEMRTPLIGTVEKDRFAAMETKRVAFFIVCFNAKVWRNGALFRGYARNGGSRRVVA